MYPPRSSELCRLVSPLLLFLPFSDSKGSFSSRHRKQTDAKKINPGRQTEVDVRYKVHQEDKVSEKKKPSDTAPKAAPPKATASKPSKPSTPLNIPLSEVSPEFKRLVVSELIKTGKARVIRGKKKDMMKK